MDLLLFSGYNIDKKRIVLKSLLTLLLCANVLFGFADSIQNISADFTQTITDETNKTITYEGHLYAMRPDMARWDYFKPVEKSVFVIGHKVTIVEPELEQAIVKTFRDEIDLFKILSRAEKIAPDTYLATHGSQKFLIKIKDGVPMAISYQDAFENHIRLRFSHQQINTPLSLSLFKPSIPQDFDLLTE